MGAMISGIAGIARAALPAIANVAKPLLTGVSTFKNSFLMPAISKIGSALGPIANGAMLASAVAPMFMGGGKPQEQGTQTDQPGYERRADGSLINPMARFGPG